MRRFVPNRLGKRLVYAVDKFLRRRPQAVDYVIRAAQSLHDVFGDEYDAAVRHVRVAHHQYPHAADWQDVMDAVHRVAEFHPDGALDEDLIVWFARELGRGTKRLQKVSTEQYVDELDADARAALDASTETLTWDPVGAIGNYLAGRMPALGQWREQTGVNIDQVRADEAIAALLNFVAEGDGCPQGEVIYKFPDGYTIQRLAPEHLEAEGEIMQHCVGGPSYAQRVARGYSEIMSLRDAQGEPHATIEWVGDEAVQIKGKQNEPPAEKYRPYIEEWIREHAERKLLTKTEERELTGVSTTTISEFMDTYDNLYWALDAGDVVFIHQGSSVQRPTLSGNHRYNAHVVFESESWDENQEFEVTIEDPDQELDQTFKELTDEIAVVRLQEQGLKNGELRDIKFEFIELGFPLGSRPVNFSHTMFHDVVFDNAVMDRAKFEGCSMDKVGVSDSDLTHADFDSSDHMDGLFRRSGMSNVSFLHAKLLRCEFVSCDLQYANLGSASCERVDWVDCNLKRYRRNRVYLADSTMSKCEFERCDMEGVDFARAELDDVLFKDCRLEEVDFEGSTLIGVVIDSRCTGEPNFDGAKLIDCDIPDSMLEGYVIDSDGLVSLEEEDE